MLITILAFFLYPNNKKDKTATFGVVDVFWIILTIASFGYILFAYTDLHVNRMSQAHTTDYVFAILCIVVLFEITRRAIGWFIPLLSIFAMVYAVYGVYFPIDF